MVYVFFAEGFEEIEALTVVDVLRRADIQTQMIGISERAVTGSHGITVQMDGLIQDIVSLDEVLMLVLPGGMPGARHLAESEALRKLLLSANASNISLAAICAAPTVLARHGIIGNRAYTCYPGFEAQIAEGQHREDLVVHDGTLITGKGAGAALPFAFKLVALIKGKTISEALEKSMIYNG